MSGIIPPEFGREQFVKLIPKDAKALEIGPFTKPAIRGENVKYFDVLDRPGLIERAKVKNYRFDEETAPNIHFVSPVGDLAVIDETFSTCFSSHTIEHQPDLIKHLAQVASILEDGGRYFMIVPDKRYCFDHFIPESTVADVMDGVGRQVHTIANVLRHRALVTHNDPLRHWRGDHGAPRGYADLGFFQRGIAEFETAEGEYVDVHAWQFTPSSFRLLMNILKGLNLSSFECEQVYQTMYGRFEFCAVLRLA